MASTNTTENIPVFFVGVKGDVRVTDKNGKEIKLKKGDKVPADASISVGTHGGKIVFKQAGQTLKYDNQGEVSLTNALIQSTDASQDTDSETLAETAEQVTSTPESGTQALQPLAQSTTRTEAVPATEPAPAKQGISESPEVVHAERGEEPQLTATEIVTQMAELIVTRSTALATPLVEKTVAAVEERTPPSPPVESVPSTPSITSFTPNTGATDDNITSARQLTVNGTATAGTNVTLLCNGAIVKQDINVTEQGQWSARINTGRDGYFNFTATSASAGGISQPSATYPIVVDSSAPKLTFDNPAGVADYNFVTYSKSATVTGTATPGLTFTLTEGAKTFEVTTSDKGLWSHHLSGLNDGMAELSASAQSVAGVEVNKSARLFVQSAPYDVKIEPDTGVDDQDRITSSKQILLKAKAQPGAKILLTITGDEHTLDVDKEGNAEFAFNLADDNTYKLQLKTIYKDNAGESDTVETDVTLDTTPATIELDKLEPVYNEPEIKISGYCNEDGATVTIKLVNVLKPEITSTVTTEVKDQSFDAQVSATEPGDYRVEITTTDIAGNTSEAEDYSFRFEIPKPELVIETRPDDSSSDTTPVWTGTFPYGGKLEATISDTTETVSVSEDNTWKYKPGSAPLPLGDYSVVFTGTLEGLSGTVTEEDHFSIVGLKMELVIDDTPGDRTNAAEPQWKGSGAAPSARVTLTLTSEKEGTEPVTKTVDADTLGGFIIALNVPEGRYATELSATAEGFEPVTRSADPITVDRTGPQLTVDDHFRPVSGDNTLTGTSTDKAGDVLVKLDEDKSYTGFITDGTFSVKLIGLTAEQTYKAQIIGTDDLGNKGEELSYGFTVQALPTMTLAVDDAPDARTNTAEPQWKGSGAAANARVTLTLTPEKDDAEPLTKTVDADAQGLFTVTLPVPEGHYTTELSATAEGFQPASLTADPFTVDRTGPELKADADFMPAAGDCVLAGTSTDPIGSVVATLGDKTFDGTIADGRYTVTITGLEPEQAYRISVVGTDDLGNKGEPLPYDFTTPALPTMTLAVDDAPDARTNTAEPQWKGSGAAANARVTLTLTPEKDDAEPLTKTVDADAQGLFTVTLPVPEGHYTTELSATAEGFQPASLTADPFTVDRTGPELHLDEGLKTDTKAFTLSGLSTDKSGSVEVVLDNGTKFSGTISEGHWSVDLSAMEEQNYIATITANDDLGNPSTQPLSFSFKVEFARPLLEVTKQPIDGASDTTPTWEGTFPYKGGELKVRIGQDEEATIDDIPVNRDNTWTYTPKSELSYDKHNVEFFGTQKGKDGIARFTQSFWIKSDSDQEPPKAFELAITEGLNATSRTVKIKGTHPQKDGKVQLQFTGDHIETVAFKGKGPTTRVKDNQWSFTLNNLLLKQKMTVQVTAIDDEKEPLGGIDPIEATLTAAGEAGNSHIASLTETRNAGSYGHSIVMRAPDCSGQCKPNDPGLKFWSTQLQALTQPLGKVRILLNKDTYDETGVLVDQTKDLYLRATPVDESCKVVLEQPVRGQDGYLKYDFFKENFKPATIHFKSQGVEHIEPFYIGVETPSLHYTFETLQEGSEYHSLTYPDHAAVTGAITQVPGSFGTGIQLGKGVLQPRYFKDLFSDSYTVCFDIKTSTRAETVDGPYPALAGYIDHDSATGAYTHLLGAFNDKGQIGIVSGDSYAVFAAPVVADGHWHHVCTVRNKLDGMSDYSIQIDGRQATFASEEFSVTEARHHHDLDSSTEVSAYPIAVLGGVQSSDSTEIQYLNATLDSFKGYAYALTPVETSAEASAYAHVHWSFQGDDYCYHDGEFPVGHMMNEMVGTELTPACSLYLTIELETADADFTVNYQGQAIDPKDGTYTVNNLSPDSLKTLTLKPTDPDAAGSFKLNFDRTESDLVEKNDAGQVTPDGIINFDASIYPLGSGISFGVGKHQNSSPTAGDPDLILEDMHLVTEEGTVIDGYDGSRAVINLDGLEALKGLTDNADKDNKLLSLLSSTPADVGNGVQIQLQHPSCKASISTCEHDPLVIVNTVDNNSMVALSLDGNLAYYQQT